MIKVFVLFHQLLFIPHWILFIQSSNRKLIIEDLYHGRDKKNSASKIGYDLTFQLSQNKYFRTLFYFRTGGFVSKVLRVFYPRDNRFIIDINTQIDGGVILAHPYGTIINAKAIGKNLYINQLVTIGENQGKRPVIRNNVKLYTNCTVIGDITIGNNCIVGAGAVVVKSVPDNSIVAGNPARIIGENKVRPIDNTVH